MTEILGGRMTVEEKVQDRVIESNSDTVEVCGCEEAKHSNMIKYERE